MVRGFSGFRTRMVYMPAACAVYEARVALVHMFVFGAVITVPDGVRLRLLVSPITLRDRHYCFTTVVLTVRSKSA